MSPSVDELLAVWERAPVKPTPEQLCAGCPERLDELRRRIDALPAGIHRSMATSPPGPPGYPGAGATADPDGRPGLTSAPDDPLAFARYGVPQVEGYDITGRLGEGGMGVVWDAVQRSTRRKVALKLMSAARFGSERARGRFAREVELAARLEHPNVARVYDSGVDRGVYFYAMERVDGGLPLDEFAAGRALSRRQSLELMLLVCRAVAHAHQRGVIHRDLKPSNILVDEAGQPHVLDFGLAKPAEHAPGSHPGAGGPMPEHTLEGEVAGTPAYMSPEQAAGRTDDIDVRTDVYSLGIILYRLLLGRPPHDLEGTFIEVIRRIADGEVRPPRTADPKCDADLETLLLKALAHNPVRRYASAAELADDVENYLRGEPLRARRPTVTYVFRKRLRKHRVPVALACVGVLMAAVATGVVANRVVAERRVRASEHQAKRALATSRAEAARVAAERGEWVKVLGEYEAATRTGFLQPLPVRLAHVRALQNLGRGADARAALSRVEAEVPGAADDARVLFRRGMLRWNHEPDAAAQSLAAARQRGLGPGDAAYADGMLAERPADAVEFLRAALRADPAHHEANAALSLMLVVLGHAREAEERARAWSLAFPAEPGAKLTRATALASLGDLDGANQLIEDVRRQVNPAAGDEMAAWVSLLHRARNLDEMVELAESDAAGLLAVVPLTPTAGGSAGDLKGLLFSLGRLAMGSSNPDELYWPRSLETLAKAVTRFSLSAVLMDADRSVEAADHLAEVLPVGVLRYMRGMNLATAGHMAEAEAELWRAIEMPSPIDCRRLAGYHALLCATEAVGRGGKPATAEQLERARRAVDVVFSAGGFRNDQEPYMAIGACIALGLRDVGRRIAVDWERRTNGARDAVLRHAELEYWDGNYAWMARLAEQVLAKEPQNERAQRYRRIGTRFIGRKDLPTALPTPEESK